jgi:hypothetical protein
MSERRARTRREQAAGRSPGQEGTSPAAQTRQEQQERELAVDLINRYRGEREQMDNPSGK